MAVVRHPVDSFNKKLNFWEEFPDYKIHKVFGTIWRVNRDKNNLELSSLFMWALSLCYDRKSAYFAQSELDKWEVVSEDLFQDIDFLYNLATSSKPSVLLLPSNYSFPEIVLEFEKTIDTPLGIALRLLEKKLADRTAFIMATEYTMDYYEISTAGRKVLKKGTADQLDRMFRDTGKINSLIQKALEELILSDKTGSIKGGGQASLTDEDNTF